VRHRCRCRWRRPWHRAPSSPCGRCCGPVVAHVQGRLAEGRPTRLARRRSHLRRQRCHAATSLPKSVTADCEPESGSLVRSGTFCGFATCRTSGNGGRLEVREVGEYQGVDCRRPGACWVTRRMPARRCRRRAGPAAERVAATTEASKCAGPCGLPQRERRRNGKPPGWAVRVPGEPTVKRFQIRSRIEAVACVQAGFTRASLEVPPHDGRPETDGVNPSGPSTALEQRPLVH